MLISQEIFTIHEIGIFVLLPIDICCSLQSSAAIALKTKKLTENLSQLNAPVLMTGLP